jgi:hypothetical protein
LAGGTWASSLHARLGCHTLLRGLLLRLQINAPVRVAVLANMPFDSMADNWQTVEAMAFETGTKQWGVFRANLSRRHLKSCYGSAGACL